MRKISDLGKRVLVGVVTIPVILALASRGGIGFLLFMDVIIAVGVWELCALERMKGMRPQVFLCMMLSLLPSWAFFIGGISYAVPLLLASVLSLLIIQLWRPDGSALMDLGGMSLVVLYLGWGGGSAVLLRRSGSGGLVMLILILVWGSDTGAYFVGRWIGRHPLWPRISPKKSVEGALAGLTASMLLALIGHYVVLGSLSSARCLIFGAIVGIGGQLGDLAESLLKRDAAIKDSSSLIPGHGGVLDRFDSFFFAAPLIYVYMTIAGSSLWR